MKGISPVISTAILLGIYSFLIFVTYTFGDHMVKKNADTILLQKAEDFLYELEKKIYEAKTSNSEEEIKFDIPGNIIIDAGQDKIYYSIKALATLYEPEKYICLSKNCNLTGSFGKDSFLILKTKSYKFEDGFINYYFLETRNLIRGNNTYKTDLVTFGNVTLKGKEGVVLKIRNLGTRIKNIDGNKTVEFLIEINVK